MAAIIGLMMVKNEDIYLKRAIRCIKDFCDEIIVIDTGSTDGTIDIAKREGVSLHIEHDLTKTHQFVERHAGDNVWIFGVDGDEIYDPAGLERLKPNIKKNYYNYAYQLQGHYIHALDIAGNEVTGHMGPPSHTPGKLYNMRNIHSWPSDGKHILFLSRPMDYSWKKMRPAPDTWELTPMRCVHTRFLRRSTKECSETVGRRLHGEDVLGFGNRTDRGGNDKVNKRLIYRKGPIVTKKIDWIEEK